MKYRATCAALLLASAVAGCASVGSVSRLETEIGSLRVTVDELARDVTKTTAETAQGRAALLERHRVVDLRISELGAQSRSTNEQLGQLRSKLDSIETALADMRGPLAALARSAAQTPPPPSPTSALATPSTRTEPQAGATSASPGEVPAEQQYATALAAFRAGEHSQAVAQLTAFVNKHPKHTLTPDAQYWIGESYFMQKDYRQALKEYQKVLDQAAGTPVAALALLRMGSSHASLRDNPRAQQAWQRLVREYPGTEAANQARTLLRGASRS